MFKKKKFKFFKKNYLKLREKSSKANKLILKTYIHVYIYIIN